MSQNRSPVQIVVDRNLYEILAQRRADRNARLAADGRPPTDDHFPFISEEQVKADEKRRAPQAAQSVTTPPQPARLSWAARSKMKFRRQTIPGFERHSRKCQLCRHPHIDAIEEVYLKWFAADLICRYFQLDDPDIVYRHARAAGLDVLRRQNVRSVVERFIEQWPRVKITSSTVLRSIHALSCLDDHGRWTDPPRTHILLRGTDPRSSDSGVPEQSASSTTETLPSVRHDSPPDQTGSASPDLEPQASRSHLINGFCQGTACLRRQASAVPKSPHNSGVLTPEVGRANQPGHL